MSKEKIHTTVYPKKQMSYTTWCKKYKVGSRVQKYSTKNFYKEGEYDHDKFIKIIKSYGNEKQSPIWRQVCETLLALCKGQMQKARNKISIA